MEILTKEKRGELIAGFVLLSTEERLDILHTLQSAHALVGGSEPPRKKRRKRSRKKSGKKYNCGKCGQVFADKPWKKKHEEKCSG